MNTLLLDQTTWDLCLDASGNEAVASDPYAIAQDVATAVRTFLSECWYDTTLGIPYFQDILGQQPPLSLITAQMQRVALTVPGVGTAVCVIGSFDQRTVTGQIQLTDTDGNPLPSVGF
ncbi:hypothetical protein AX768_09240 [Burkholderia sp. PAMC 28687]|uniref:hypothetical protein n=1 Tax=Burkholderia sp. PAMC 28687 TaxID=1795874 RepID=UPI000784E44A|nr:hypothetical protein [Burkholderia sp. PAMC 28687]AMM14253.1 hypothetical protein AX768_09240 [Burkholderia sp. PAMC 28687]